MTGLYVTNTNFFDNTMRVTAGPHAIERGALTIRYSTSPETPLGTTSIIIKTTTYIYIQTVIKFSLTTITLNKFNS